MPPHIPQKFIPKKIREKVGSSEFKARVREVKNQVLDYTEAEMLVREATCNSPDPINPVLCRGIVKYVRTADWPPIVAIIAKRLSSKNANHPLKVMQLIEILLSETTGIEHEAVWRDIVIQNQTKIDELKHFDRVVDKVDTGVNVRPLAIKLMARIYAEQHKRDEASMGITSKEDAEPKRTSNGGACASSAPAGSGGAAAPSAPPIAHAEPAASRSSLATGSGEAGNPNLLEFDLLSIDGPQMQQPQMQPQLQPQGAYQQSGYQQQSMSSGPMWGGPPPPQMGNPNMMQYGAQRQPQQGQQPWQNPANVHYQ